MALPEMAEFQLVGGTALSLYYGHRLSVDLDLFATKNFHPETIISCLEKQFPGFTYSSPNQVGIFAFIDGIKTDLINYGHHPIIGFPIVDNNIRLFSTDDIAAMKIAAILKRAVKKDFYDIAELLDHYSVDTIIDCYRRKFPSQQLLISIPQAMTYFVEADESEDPMSLNGQTWQKVKQKIQKKVSKFLQ